MQGISVVYALRERGQIFFFFYLSYVLGETKRKKE